MFRGILLLFLKEMRILLKDKRSRMVLIVPPIIQTIVFGYGANFDLEHIPIAIFDEDHSATSRQLVSHFVGSKHFQHVYTLLSDGPLRSIMDNRSVLAVLHVGRDFERELSRGGAGRIQLIMDGRNSNTASVTLRYTVDVVDNFFNIWEKDHHSVTPRFHVEIRSWFNENLKTRWYIVPGLLGLLTLVICVLISAMSISREKEQSTLEHLLITRLDMHEIFISKAAPAVIIGVIEATLMLAIGILWFAMPFRGEFATLYFAICLLVFSGSGIGLCLSRVAANLQQSVIYAFLFIIPAILLSGFVTPTANMETPIQWLSFFNPLRHFIAISRSVFLEGASVRDLWAEFSALAAVSLASMLAAWLAFRSLAIR